MRLLVSLQPALRAFEFGEHGLCLASGSFRGGEIWASATADLKSLLALCGPYHLFGERFDIARLAVLLRAPSAEPANGSDATFAVA